MRKIRLKTEPAEIGDRQFLLHEHADDKVEEYARLQSVCVLQAAGAQSKGAIKILEQTTLGQTTDGIAEVFGDAAAANFSLWQFVLCDPTDGKGPITEEWVRANINSRMAIEIMSWQDELDNMAAYWSALGGMLKEAEKKLAEQVTA